MLLQECTLCIRPKIYHCIIFLTFCLLSILPSFRNHITLLREFILDTHNSVIVPFPSQLRNVDDLFRFSFGDLEYILNGFNQTQDIQFRLLELSEFLSKQIDIDDEVVQLVKNELEIIEFSKESRNSVIHF